MSSYRTGLGLGLDRTWPIGQLIGFEFEYRESLAKYELGFLADGLVAREVPPRTPLGGWPGRGASRRSPPVPENYRIPNNPIHVLRALRLLTTKPCGFKADRLRAKRLFG